jgi:hypothetical protein
MLGEEGVFSIERNATQATLWAEMIDGTLETVAEFIERTGHQPKVDGPSKSKEENDG